jgi:glycosyltransferase involved in cell wall biosynthesis
MAVIIAGTFPPPYGGQNINTERVFRLLNDAGVPTRHWEFRFSKTTSEFRRGGLKKFIELLRVLGRLIGLGARVKIDLLLYPSGGPHFAPGIRDIVLLPFAALAAKRVIVQFRAAGIAEVLPHRPWWFRHFLTWAHRRCFGAISLSAFGKRDPLALGFSRIKILPNAIEDLCPQAKAWPSDPASFSFLHIGHLCPDKGTQDLLEAINNARAICPGIRLHLVGECLAPWTPEILQQKIHELELESCVTWHGALKTEVALAQYQPGRMVVFSSVAPYESFGMILIEAMMMRLPLIVSNWRANAEVAGPNFGGLLYEPAPDHAANLADSLRSAWEQRDQWQAWGQRNRQIYEERYTMEQFRARLLEIIKDEDWI